MKIILKGEYKTNKVWFNGELLSPKKSLRYRQHSPDGFAWGYGGSGPAQLALAICLEIFPKESALRVYQAFKWKYIAVLPQSDFDITFTLL